MRIFPRILTISGLGFCIGCLCLLVLVASSLDGGEQADDFAWPLPGNYTISSSFGEYRPGHAHMAIDIRTGGETGIPVVAVGDGYISRIKVKTSGYGRALYLTLEDGRIAVYSHLQSFVSPVEEYITDMQWRTMNFNQDVYPSADLFRFHKGDIIAYSGRSGTRHPHLHFELRTSSNIPLNPLAHGFNIDDRRPPVFSALGVLPLNAFSEVAGDCVPQVFPAYRTGTGEYRISESPKVYGLYGLAVLCYDLTDNAPNKIAVYRLELEVEGETRFIVQYDSCGFDTYRQVEIDRDPYLNRLDEGIFQRLFQAPGNKMPFYQGEGILNTEELPGGLYNFTIYAEDYCGNTSLLRGELELLQSPTVQEPALQSFNNFREYAGNAAFTPECELQFFHDWVRVEFSTQPDVIQWIAQNLYLIPFQANNGKWFARIPLNEDNIGHNYIISSNGNVIDNWRLEYINVENGGVVSSKDSKFTISFPPYGVFQPFFAGIKEVDVSYLNEFYELADSAGYCLEPQWIPLKRIAEISWNVPDTSSQLGIYFLQREKPIFLGNRLSGAEISAGCLNLETFILVYDRTPPEVRLNYPRSNSPIREKKPKFRFTVEDTLSGIDAESINITLDGSWILAEYDPPVKKIYGHLREPLSAGEYQLIISLRDKCGNEASKTYKIVIE